MCLQAKATVDFGTQIETGCKKVKNIMSLVMPGAMHIYLSQVSTRINLYYWGEKITIVSFFMYVSQTGNAEH